MQQDYDRYSILANSDGTYKMMPFVNLPVNPSDKYEYWNTASCRYEKLANKYYGNPFYDFLILYGNPQFASEYDIPDGQLIRVPFPLSKAKSDYENALKTFKNQ